MVATGTFKINKRLDIETCKPFVIRGAAQDVSRLLWHECPQGEGIGIEPSGCVTKFVNDGHVSIERAPFRTLFALYLCAFCCSGFWKTEIY